MTMNVQMYYDITSKGVKSIMAKTSALTVRMDPELKQDCTEILEKIGITPSQAITFYFRQIVLNKGIPFELRVPSDEMVLALQEADDIASGRINKEDQ